MTTNSVGDLANFEADFQLEAGETVKCTFYNLLLLDYGDAPDSHYKTLLASNGARHPIVAGHSLGRTCRCRSWMASLQSWRTGMTSIPCQSGRRRWRDLPAALVAGDPAARSLWTVDLRAGMLDAWIDFNGNGVFDHPARASLGWYQSSRWSPAAADRLTFAVPANAALGTTYARFRLSIAGNLPPIGFAPDGEVEDYTVEIVVPNHTVTFNANGGTGTMAAQTANVPTALTLNTFTRTGYSFSGWNTVAGGGGTTYTDGQTYDFSADITLYAQWLVDTYALDVTISGSGTVGQLPETGPYAHGTTVVLTPAAGVGSTFNGWSGTDAGGLIDNGNGSWSIVMDGAKELTATFTLIPLTCYVPRLIAAIEAANADPDATTIDLDDDCTYNLTAAYAADPDGYGPVGLPPITTPITLLGSNTTITRNATAAFRLFYVTTTGSLTIENVTLSNGLAQGGNGGHAQYDGGGGGGGMGGAIFNRGALTLTNVTLTGNKALGGHRRQ